MYMWLYGSSLFNFGPTLNSQPCYVAMTSLHLLFITLVSIVFYYWCIICEYFLYITYHTIIIAVTPQFLMDNFVHRHNYEACSSLICCR